ncbi:MAG: hypothetical protein H6981_07740 [Gammaproteobacteria bacterium]|nr:hypothetical protein [Gammaproteobacteria bacterium]MCP5136676.1 hypothetical protein [Gammaproteobacteria bacterium]
MKRRDNPIDEVPDLEQILDKFESRVDRGERIWFWLTQGLGRLRWRFTVRLVRMFDLPRIGILLDTLFVLYIAAVIGALLFGAFWAAYAFKSWMGIDLIPGYHLIDP